MQEWPGSPSQFKFRTHFLKTVCLFLAVLGLHCCVGYSLAVESTGSGLLTAVASLVVPRLVTHGLSWARAYRVFLEQGLNPCLLDLQADSLPLSYEGSSSNLGLILPSNLYMKTIFKMFRNFLDFSTDCDFVWISLRCNLVRVWRMSVLFFSPLTLSWTKFTGTFL